jgi:hypothetical protein
LLEHFSPSKIEPEVEDMHHRKKIPIVESWACLRDTCTDNPTTKYSVHPPPTTTCGPSGHLDKIQWEERFGIQFGNERKLSRHPLCQVIRVEVAFHKHQNSEQLWVLMIWAPAFINQSGTKLAAFGLRFIIQISYIVSL